MSDRSTKSSLLRRVLEILGLSRAAVMDTGRKKPMSITDAVQRMEDANKHLEHVEQVTMSWTAADMTEEQQRAAGLIE